MKSSAFKLLMARTR